MITDIDLIGLDLAPAAVWYRKHDAEIMSAMRNLTALPQLGELEPKLDISIRMLGGQFTRHDVWLALGLFPINARRVILNLLTKIIGKSTLWFNQQSTADNPQPTKNLNEAISPTALAPSYYRNVTVQGELIECEIELYWLPEEFCSRNTAHALTFQGLVHELAHVYLIDLWTNRSFPNGEDAMIEFGKYIEKARLDPISHYSATYWKKPNRLLMTKKLDGNESAGTQVPLHEEMAESIAAYLLGFAFCEPFETGLFSQPGRKGYGFQPFADRPQVKDYIHDLLHAKSNKN